MARSLFRRLTGNFLLFLNVIGAVLFLIACAIPYLNPATWWFTGFISLMMPYLAIFLFFFILFWLYVKPRNALLSLVCFIIGWKQLSVLFGFHFQKEFQKEKTETSIRLIDWNVASMASASNNKEKKKHARTEIADAILNLNPDIICLQEFSHSETQGEQANNVGLFSKEYPYYHFSKDYVKRNGFYEYGSIIFSKFPIINSGRIEYPGNLSESLAFADIIKNEDTIRIFTTHLQSFRFNERDYMDIEKIKQQNEELWKASKNIFRKMRYAFTRRGEQAAIVRKELDKSPYPSVICGDFNDVPNSYTYFHIRGNRKDAFLEGDYGVGRTYLALAPTLRIDYILPGKEFEVVQFEMVDEDLSDHLMLISDLRLKK